MVVQVGPWELWTDMGKEGVRDCSMKGEATYLHSYPSPTFLQRAASLEVEKHSSDLFISLLVMCPLHSGESPHLHCGWWCPWGLPLLATSASWRKLSRLEWHQLISFKIRLSSSPPQGLSKCCSFCCLEHNSHPSSSSYASVGKTLPWVILLCCCRLPSNTLMTHLNFLFERNYSYFGY